jgi:hypothetical protein
MAVHNRGLTPVCLLVVALIGVISAACTSDVRPDLRQGTLAPGDLVVLARSNVETFSAPAGAAAGVMELPALKATGATLKVVRTAPTGWYQVAISRPPQALAELRWMRAADIRVTHAPQSYGSPSWLDVMRGDPVVDSVWPTQPFRIFLKEREWNALDTSGRDALLRKYVESVHTNGESSVVELLIGPTMVASARVPPRQD